MSRLLVLSFLVSFIALAALSAAPVPKHLMSKDDSVCCPTRVGDRLVHDLGGRELVEVVTKVEKTDSGLAVTFEWVGENGAHTAGEIVIASDRGLQVVEYAGQKMQPPLWNLKLPHRDGNRWSETWNPGNQTWHLQTSGWEEVKVPAGTFQAIKVERTEVSNQLGGMTGSTTYWYAPGIGCIKWSSDGRSRVLKSITHDK